MQLAGVAIEQVDAGVREDATHLAFLSRLHIVVAQHGRRGDAQGGQLLREDGRLLGQSVVGEIARDKQYVGRFRNPGEQGLKRALRALAAVQIGQRGDSECRSRHRG